MRHVQNNYITNLNLNKALIIYNKREIRQLEPTQDVKCEIKY